MAGCFGLHQGHPPHVPPERFAESRPCLNVFNLQRVGALVDGAVIELRIGDGECLRLVRAPGKISIGNQAITIGSHPKLPMPVFTCPGCGTARYRLYEVEARWACRRCHKLDYASRHTYRSVPGLHRLRWLRRRLGADPRPFTPLPPKPPHWRRYWRLAREVRTLEEALVRHGREDVAGVLEKRLEKRP